MGFPSTQAAKQPAPPSAMQTLETSIEKVEAQATTALDIVIDISLALLGPEEDADDDHEIVEEPIGGKLKVLRHRSNGTMQTMDLVLGCLVEIKEAVQ